MSILSAEEKQALQIMFTSDAGVPLKMEENKPRLSLVPREAVELLAEVYTTGANKYGVDSWREFTPGQAQACLPDAALRHLLAHFAGEEFDKETGLPHLAQCAWNCLTLSIVNNRGPQ